MKYLNHIFSIRGIQVIAVLEIAGSLILIQNRIERVLFIKNIDPGLRKLINIVDYESGWNFIFLIILITSSFLSFRTRQIGWILKQATLITLLVSIGSVKTLIGIAILILLAYYSNNRIITVFKIKKAKKIKFYSISVLGAVILILSYFFIPILNY